MTLTLWIRCSFLHPARSRVLTVQFPLLCDGEQFKNTTVTLFHFLLALQPTLQLSVTISFSESMPLSKAVKDIQQAATRDPALALELIGKLNRADLSREDRPLVRAIQNDIELNPHEAPPPLRVRPPQKSGESILCLLVYQYLS